MQVVDVEHLTIQLGSQDLTHSVQDSAKAVLTRVFSTLHLDQISAPSKQQQFDLNASEESDDSVVAVSPLAAKAIKRAEELDHPFEPDGFLGADRVTSKEGQTRNHICEQVMNELTPIFSGWGVKLINFQLESTRLTGL